MTSVVEKSHVLTTGASTFFLDRDLEDRILQSETVSHNIPLTTHSQYKDLIRPRIPTLILILLLQPIDSTRYSGTHLAQAPERLLPNPFYILHSHALSSVSPIWIPVDHPASETSHRICSPLSFFSSLIDLRTVLLVELIDVLLCLSHSRIIWLDNCVDQECPMSVLLTSRVSVARTYLELRPARQCVSAGLEPPASSHRSGLAEQISSRDLSSVWSKVEGVRQAVPPLSRFEGPH
jgi:hypothetical protein